MLQVIVTALPDAFLHVAPAQAQQWQEECQAKEAALGEVAQLKQEAADAEELHASLSSQVAGEKESVALLQQQVCQCFKHSVSLAVVGGMFCVSVAGP